MNGTTDKAKGRVEEAVGVLTNDKKLKIVARWIRRPAASRMPSGRQSTRRFRRSIATSTSSSEDPFGFPRQVIRVRH